MDVVTGALIALFIGGVVATVGLIAYTIFEIWWSER